MFYVFEVVYLYKLKCLVFLFVESKISFIFIKDKLICNLCILEKMMFFFRVKIYCFY